MRKLIPTLFVLLVTASAAWAQNSIAKLEGQVVCCAECWAEEDRTKVEFGTVEDLLKAKSCVEGGDPTLLAVREGETFTLYQLEQGKFRLSEKNWLSYVGKQVSATGTVQSRKTGKIFRVDALTIVRSSLAEREAGQAVGRDVELKLTDLSGVEQNLSSLKGRIVILNFWATYCIPCREEMPDLAAIQNEYAALGVQVIGASADEAADRAKVMQFIKETKVNFPIWMGATSADMRRFGLGSALPGTVIVGRDGRIARVISGIVNQADLKKQIETLLAMRGNSSTVKEGVAKASLASAPKRPAEVSSVPS